MAADAPSPSFLTVADRVNVVPAAGPLSLTDGDDTTKSGWPSGSVTVICTLTCTDVEQLFVVSDSSDTASTHAP